MITKVQKLKDISSLYNLEILFTRHEPVNIGNLINLKIIHIHSFYYCDYCMKDLHLLTNLEEIVIDLPMSDYEEIFTKLPLGPVLKKLLKKSSNVKILVCENKMFDDKTNKEYTIFYKIENII